VDRNPMCALKGRDFMRRLFMSILCGLAACLSLSNAAWASGPDPDDYPLRVHVFKSVARPNANNAYATKNPANMADYIDGQGAADLFENGEPHGFLFTFSCMQTPQTSGGYATYPAKWKKKDKVLEILLPETGKPWNMETCDLQPAMRPGLAYFWNDKDDTVVEQSSAVFKDWMVKHQYNPEKGLDLPSDAVAAPDGDRGSGWSSSQHSGSH
jgi:hypothetical protein